MSTVGDLGNVSVGTTDTAPFFAVYALQVVTAAKGNLVVDAGASHTIQGILTGVHVIGATSADLLGTSEESKFEGHSDTTGFPYPEVLAPLTNKKRNLAFVVVGEINTSSGAVLTWGGPKAISRIADDVDEFVLNLAATDEPKASIVLQSNDPTIIHSLAIMFFTFNVGTTYTLGFSPGDAANREDIGGNLTPEAQAKIWAGDTRFVPNIPTL